MITIVFLLKAQTTFNQQAHQAITSSQSQPASYASLYPSLTDWMGLDLNSTDISTQLQTQQPPAQSVSSHAHWSIDSWKYGPHRKTIQVGTMNNRLKSPWILNLSWEKGGGKSLFEHFICTWLGGYINDFFLAKGAFLSEMFGCTHTSNLEFPFKFAL